MTRTEKILRKIDKLEFHGWTLIAKSMKPHGNIHPRGTPPRILKAEKLFTEAASMRMSLQFREIARARELEILNQRHKESKELSYSTRSHR
jgi:hypothetical protein